MMKKQGIALSFSSALLLSSVALASTQGNWVAGVEGGYGERSGHFNVNVYNPPNLQTVYRQDMTQNNYLLGLLGGYQYICDEWLVGLELNFDWQRKHKHNNFTFNTLVGTTWNDSSHYTRDYNLGLTARVGYFLSPLFMPYIRAGAEASRDRLTLTGVDTVGNTFSASDRHTNYRFVGGVGLETPIPQVSGLTARIEYNFVARGKVLHANTVAAPTPIIINSDWGPHANLGKIALVYNFS